MKVRGGDGGCLRREGEDEEGEGEGKQEGREEVRGGRR